MFHVKHFQMIRTEKLNVSLKIFKNASAFLQLRAGCNVYSSLRGFNPPCISMRINTPVEHCVAETIILHREIVLTMKTNFTLCAYLTSKMTSITR